MARPVHGYLQLRREFCFVDIGEFGSANFQWYGGAIPAAAVTFGTNFIDSNLSWQIPVILQCLSCLIVLALVPFIPESPRYLIAKGRNEEALAFLTRYRESSFFQRAAMLMRRWRR